MESFRFIDWGLIEYKEAYEKQKSLFEEALENKKNAFSVENTLIFCEHYPVVTIGKNGKTSNLLYSEEKLALQGVSLFHVDRGGDVTFHGPGQLVGYPIFDLESMGLGLKEYIFLLENIIITLLESYGIKSGQMPGTSGVWLDTDKPALSRKICAIGVRSSKYVTMHGFALNVSTDLNYFRLINPCGFTDKGVTSMEKELGMKINMEALKSKLQRIFLKKLKIILPTLQK